MPCRPRKPPSLFTRSDGSSVFHASISNREKHPSVLTPAKAGRPLCVTRSGT